MKQRPIRNGGEAWDYAEKRIAERGRPWAINRRGARFWIESGDDIRVTVIEAGNGEFRFVVDVHYARKEKCSWQMSFANALDELLTMIDAMPVDDSVAEVPLAVERPLVTDPVGVALGEAVGEPVPEAAHLTSMTPTAPDQFDGEATP